MPRWLQTSSRWSFYLPEPNFVSREFRAQLLVRSRTTSGSFLRLFVSLHSLYFNSKIYFKRTCRNLEEEDELLARTKVSK